MTLTADNDVSLLAAQNKASQNSANKSSGASIGIGFAIGGTQNGFTLDLGVNKARGKADGEDISYANTHVNAGNNVKVNSGGDTTLKGGVIAADNVQANVGGNLNIESLQDSSTYTSKQVSAGVNLSLCVPPFCYGASTVGGSLSKSKVNGDFLSVAEQSGIKSGDGGFQVQVGGNTDLKGGLISSSQAAVDQSRNVLTTASMTASDLKNRDSFNASGFAVSGSVSGAPGDQASATKEADILAAKNGAKAGPSASGGFSSSSGSQESTTYSGISGGAVNITDQAKQLATGKDAATALADVKRDVTTESANGGVLAKAWDAQQLQKEVNAGVAITQEFSKHAPKAIADYSNKKIQELKSAGGSVDEIAKWDEGGAYRVALHTVSGALTGGVGGAIGSGAVASSADILNELQDKAIAGLVAQGLSPGAALMVAQGIAEATALGVGSAAGGSGGASAALTTDTNNRQLDRNQYEFARKNARIVGQKLGINEVVAEGRIVAEMMRNSDKDYAVGTGGIHDYEVRSIVSLSEF